MKGILLALLAIQVFLAYLWPSDWGHLPWYLVMAPALLVIAACFARVVVGLSLLIYLWNES